MMVPKLQGCLKIQEIVKKPKWRVAAFQFDRKQSLELAVKYLLKELYNKDGEFGQSGLPKGYKVREY